MSIIYYPNRVYKGQVPAIDRVMAKRQTVSTTGSANLASAALDTVIYSDDNWMVDSISFAFNSATPRNFSAFIENGRAVVENLNDYLWFYVAGTARQKITLTPGFYNGTELATELQTRLNANAAYVAAGVTFTVTYSAATGQYTIQTDGPDIGYLNENNQADFRTKDSIAGHLFGLNETTQEITLTAACLPGGVTGGAPRIMDVSALSDNVASDTLVFGLDDEISIINQSNSAATSYYHNTLHVLTMDQAIHLTSNVGADVIADYIVIYEAIV